MSAPLQPRMSPAAFLSLVQARQRIENASVDQEAIVIPFPPRAKENPRVNVYPSADGTVLLVGVTIKGQWVAEYRCLAADFDDRCVRAMERRVRQKERDRVRPL